MTDEMPDQALRAAGRSAHSIGSHPTIDATPAETTEAAIRVAFADLRTREISRTLAPGTGAARQTVRRRRQRTAATVTAGLTVLLLLGGGYLAEGGGSPDPAQPAGFGSPSEPSRPTPGYAGWMDLDPDEVPLSGLASAAVGRTDGRTVHVSVFDFTPGQVLYDGEPVLAPPAWLVPPSAATPYLVMGDSNVSWGAAHAQADDYRLQVACAGPPASLDLTVQVGVHAATVTVECAPTGEDAAAGRAETQLGAYTKEEFAAGFAVSVWRGELPGPPLERAIAFSLRPEHYLRPTGPGN